MNQWQRRRYSRQLTVSEFGEISQQRLLDSRVLIVGLGGLGSPAAMYLAAAGIGTLVLSDFDRVEESNLQRQIIHRQEELGESKVYSAQRTLKSLNSECQVIPKPWQLDVAELAEEIDLANLVLDCSDNFATRYALNKACVIGKTPLISGAAVRQEGQIMAIIPPNGACYQCLYPINATDAELETCETCNGEGVIAPVVGVIGSLQALQAVQILTGNVSNLIGRLLIFNGVTMQWRALQVPRDPICPVCGNIDRIVM